MSNYGPPPGQQPSYGPPPAWGPPQREQQQRTSPVLIAVVGILVVMALGAGVLLYVKRDKDPVPVADGSGTGRSAHPGGAVKLKGRLACLGALVAYSSEDGKDLWRLTPPRIGGKKSEFCGMSRSTSGGVGAVAFGLPRPGRSSALCTSVGLVHSATISARAAVSVTSWLRREGSRRT